MGDNLIQTAKTRRFCRNCVKETTFILNEVTNHSICRECGKSEAFNLENTRAIHWFKAGYRHGRKMSKREDLMECKCGSDNIEPYIIIPEVKQGTVIGKCRDCGEDIKQGKSIFG